MKGKELITIILKKYKWLCMLGLIFSFIFSFFVTCMPIASQYLIDEVLNTSNKSDILKGIFIFFIICIMQPLLFYIKEIIFINLCEKISYNLRKDLFIKISKLSISYFDCHNYGELNIKVIEDTKKVANFFYVLLSVLITSILITISLLVAMFFQNWFLSIFIIFLLLLLISINMYFSKKIQSQVVENISIFEELQSSIKNTYDNSVLIKLYSFDYTYDNKINEILKKLKNSKMAIQKYSLSLNSFSMLITSIALSLIYGIGALMVANNISTLGKVISMGLFFQNLVSPLNSIINANVNYKSVKPSFSRLYDLLNEEEEPGDLAIPLDNITIRFDNVYFKYKTSTKFVISNLSFVIDSNGLYGIRGDSGCGKTSLAKLLLGLYSVNEGEISICGININNINKRQLRDQISYMPQDIDLLNDTIINNILISNPNSTFDEIKEICKKTHLDTKIMSLPNNYYAKITDKINLSGGEKRRLALSRCLNKKAKIYIFDEPESYLEEEYQSIIKKIVTDLSSTSIVFLITHNSKLLENCDILIEV